VASSLTPPLPPSLSLSLSLSLSHRHTDTQTRILVSGYPRPLSLSLSRARARSLLRQLQSLPQSLSQSRCLTSECVTSVSEPLVHPQDRQNLSWYLGILVVAILPLCTSVSGPIVERSRSRADVHTQVQARLV
jgi:hypothetical protein